MQVDSRDWTLNGNTLSLDEETVIDVPEPYNRVSKYCASLGHKANHSFTPNCIYDMWVGYQAASGWGPENEEGTSKVSSCLEEGDFLRLFEGPLARGLMVITWNSEMEKCFKE